MVPFFYFHNRIKEISIWEKVIDGPNAEKFGAAQLETAAPKSKTRPKQKNRALRVRVTGHPDLQATPFS
jgi:hypothetical protein